MSDAELSVDSKYLEHKIFPKNVLYTMQSRGHSICIPNIKAKIKVKIVD